MRTTAYPNYTISHSKTCSKDVRLGNLIPPSSELSLDRPLDDRSVYLAFL